MDHNAQHATSVNPIPWRLLFAHLAALISMLSVCQISIAQQANENVTPIAEMIDSMMGDGPNQVPTMHLRVVGSVARGNGSEFSIPVKFSEANCSSSKCETNSSLNQDTEILNANGDVLNAYDLDKHHNYKVFSIRLHDLGPGLVEQIILMPAGDKKGR